MKFALTVAACAAGSVAFASQSWAGVVQDFEGLTPGGIHGQDAPDATFSSGWRAKGNSDTASGNVVDLTGSSIMANGLDGEDQAVGVGRSRDKGPVRFFNTDLVPTDSDPVYIGWLMRMPSNGKAWIFDPGGNWDHTYIGINGDKGIINRSYKNGETGTTTVDTSLDMHLVVKITGSDITLWVNPANESATPLHSVIGVGNWSSIQGIGVTSDINGGTTYFDQLMIGDSFADVSAIPEPASLALLGLGGLAMLRRR